ncbi:MAG: TolC family outer membrane protein [Pseudomonadota bacterium]
MSRLRFLALAAAFMPSAAIAQTTEALLRQLVEENPQLQSSELQAQAARADLTAARGAFLPQIAIEASTSRVDESFQINGVPGTLSATREPTQAAASVTQALFTSGRIGGSVGAARAQAREARSSYDGDRQRLIVAGAAAIADVVRDRAVLRERRANEEVVRGRLEESVARRRAGLATRTDVQQSEARFAGASAERIAAQGALQRSLASFQALFGVAAPDVLTLPAAPAALPADLDEALQRALAENPQLNASDQRAEAARQVVRAERGQLLPQVSLNATAGYLDNERFGIELGEAEQVTVSLQGRWNLFSGGSGYARTRAAQRRADAAKSLALQTRRAIREETIAAWTNVVAGRAALAAREAQVRAASTAAEGVAAEFRSGRRTRLDVLDADREKTDADVALIAARRDLAVAEFLLLSATGAL